jgi:hypothetical protein
MVIIDVREGYREAAMVAMRMSLCRSSSSCGELVERAFLPWRFSDFDGNQCGNLLFHVEHLRELGQ